MDFGAILTDYILPHWPFFAWMAIAMIIGRVVTLNIFTKTAHYTRKPVWFWWWGRKTLALHPILAGAMLGIFWRNPEPGVDTLAACMGYFAASGGLSVWAYELVKGLAKKQGYDLKIPGEGD